MGVHDEDTSLVVCEVKAPGEALGFSKKQAESYAFASRAPFLLLTNGEDLEIWQAQIGGSSTLQTRCRISELAGHRAAIEGSIAKAAASHHCRSILRKGATRVSTDLAAYVVAEARRMHTEKTPAPLRLRSDSASEFLHSSDLLSEAPNGAMIVGQSGAGKSTLGSSLHRHATARYRMVAGGKVPMHVNLTDLDERETILEYMSARIKAYCPAVSEAVLEGILREDGGVLICDSFDRLKSDQASDILRSLRTLLRDFPNLQIFVVGTQINDNSLGLSTLTVMPLDHAEQAAIVRGLSPSDPDLIDRMPDLLRSLCDQPLLLEQVIAFTLQNRSFPKELIEVFQGWLDRITGGGPRGGASECWSAKKLWRPSRWRPSKLH